MREWLLLIPALIVGCSKADAPRGAPAPTNVAASAAVSEGREPIEPAPLAVWKALFAGAFVTQDEAILWHHGSREIPIAAAAEGTKAHLVTLDGEVAVPVPGGTFETSYDPEATTMIYATAGSRLVARMSSAANDAVNCEALLVDASASSTLPRVVDRWRGDCGEGAPFEKP